MKAIILAAGYATRLYPLTINRPKALLPINGKPIIEYILDEIHTIPDIDETFVVSNQKFYEHFEAWANTLKHTKPVRILNDGTATEEDRRGAIGDIAFVLETCHVQDDIMVIAGDNFFTYRLKDCYDFYRKLGKDCVCAKPLPDVEELRRMAVATLAPDGRVIELHEKPENPQSNIAVYATYIYRADTLPLFFEYLAEGNKKDAPGYFVQWLYTRKDVYAYQFEGECYDIGTPKSYEEVQVLFQK